MSRAYCTLFDKGYLIKGLSMLRSLQKWDAQCFIYVLCMDDVTYRVLFEIDLPYVSLIQLSELEDEDLRRVKIGRGKAEYCWTLSPCLPYYILSNHKDVNFITYVDADLYFYSPVDAIYDEAGDGSLVITGHKFTQRLKPREENGLFCVQWVSFRRDQQGMNCLSRWRQQCIDWCFYRLEDGKMGDQKYLDEWPILYPACHVVKNNGAGVAPWNFPNYSIHESKDGSILVDGTPLIFYHFHQMQILSDGRFNRLSEEYRADGLEPDCIYRVYENALKSSLAEIRKVYPGFVEGMQISSKVAVRRFFQSYIPMNIKNFIRRFMRL